MKWKSFFLLSSEFRQLQEITKIPTAFLSPLSWPTPRMGSGHLNSTRLPSLQEQHLVGCVPVVYPSTKYTGHIMYTTWNVLCIKFVGWHIMYMYSCMSESAQSPNSILVWGNGVCTLCDWTVFSLLTPNEGDYMFALCLSVSHTLVFWFFSTCISMQILSWMAFYRSSSSFVPIGWFLAELRTLDLFQSDLLIFNGIT